MDFPELEKIRQVFGDLSYLAVRDLAFAVLFLAIVIVGGKWFKEASDDGVWPEAETVMPAKRKEKESHG